MVRVDGRRQVYVPVYRQSGYSTLSVVDTLKDNLPDMKERLTTPDVDLKVVMDQSVYVRKAIESLAEEGVLGAVLCSLVILLFLGEWRMTHDRRHDYSCCRARRRSPACTRSGRRST